MYVNAEARLKSWFERLWQLESEGYSCTRAFRGRHYNWDSKHVTRFSVYARGSFPRSGSQTRTASEFSNYPGSSRVCSMLHLKNAWGSLWWDIWRCTFFEASGGWIHDWMRLGQMCVWFEEMFVVWRLVQKELRCCKKDRRSEFPWGMYPLVCTVPITGLPSVSALSLSQISYLDRWHIGLVLVVSI